VQCKIFINLITKKKVMVNIKNIWYIDDNKFNIFRQWIWQGTDAINVGSNKA